MIKVGHYNFFIIYKNEWNNLSKNGDVILNRAIDYSKNDKERLRDNARDNTEIHLKKKKIKREYGRNRYHIISEEMKQLKEYQKKYCEANKSRKS